MITISNQIKELEPVSWYNFKPDTMNILFDKNASYGVDPDNSYIFNAVNAQYLLPKWNRPTENFDIVDPDYMSNQLADSEFLVEDDASLMVGRNKSRMGGIFAQENYEDHISVDVILDRITNKTERDYLFQFKASSNLLKANYVTFNYTDNNENFVPVVYDTKKPESSFSVTETYQNTQGTYEIWGGNFNPEFLPPDGFGIEQDMREITLKLVNSVTGATVGKNDRTYMFTRNGTLNDLNSEAVPDIFVDTNIYTQPESNSSANDRFELLDIYILKNNRYYRMKVNKNMQLNIPVADKIYFKVKTPYLFNNRSYNLGEDNITVANSACFMHMLGLKFYYSDDRRIIEMYDTYNKAMVNGSFSAGSDEAHLFYIKTRYQVDQWHNPSIGDFNYVLEIEIDKVTSGTEGRQPIFIKRYYRGGLTEILWKGITPVQSLPNFDAYPLMFGHMPENYYNQKSLGYNSSKKIDCKVSNNTTVNIDVPDKMIYRSAYDIVAVDNICYYDKDVYYHIYKLFKSQYREDKSVLDRTLIQYWPCEKLNPPDLRSTANTINSGTNNWNMSLYGEMRFSGEGQVTEEKVWHNVVKGCLNFDGKVLGNSATTATWSNTNKYTINFWFKSTQKTKGVILCDMDHHSITTAGIYIGVSYMGTLEVAVNSRSSRIYTTNITDGQWHMITVACRTVLGQVSYAVFVDGQGTGDNDLISTTGSYNKDYGNNYQTYIMGHPLGNFTKGSISRLGFYGTQISNAEIFEIYRGDIEHRIYGTVLASNMPYETDIRFFNYRTGEYISTVRSDKETGKFVYRNYDGNAVHLLVVNNDHRYGTIQVMGPLNPASVPN